MATSNDVKSAHRVKTKLVDFSAQDHADADVFLKGYHQLLRDLQADLGSIGPAPIISTATQAVRERKLRDRALLTQPSE